MSRSTPERPNNEEEQDPNTSLIKQKKKPNIKNIPTSTQPELQTNEEISKNPGKKNKSFFQKLKNMLNNLVDGINKEIDNFLGIPTTQEQPKNQNHNQNMNGMRQSQSMNGMSQSMNGMFQQSQGFPRIQESQSFGGPKQSQNNPNMKYNESIHYDANGNPIGKTFFNSSVSPDGRSSQQSSITTIGHNYYQPQPPAYYLPPVNYESQYKKPQQPPQIKEDLPPSYEDVTRNTKNNHPSFQEAEKIRYSLKNDPTNIKAERPTYTPPKEQNHGKDGPGGRKI